MSLLTSKNVKKRKKLMTFFRRTASPLLLEEEDLDIREPETEEAQRRELKYLINLIIRRCRQSGIFRLTLLHVLLETAETLWDLLAPDAREVGIGLELELEEVSLEEHED